jgi:hypothetical protein
MKYFVHFETKIETEIEVDSDNRKDAALTGFNTHYEKIKNISRTELLNTTGFNASSETEVKQSKIFIERLKKRLMFILIMLAPALVATAVLVPFGTYRFIPPFLYLTIAGWLILTPIRQLEKNREKESV